MGLGAAEAPRIKALPLPVLPSMSTRHLHLNIVGQAPVSEGPHGCDYVAYPQYDFAAYRCLPHRWNPLDESGYAQWQAQDIDDREGYDTPEELAAAVVDARAFRAELLPPPPPDDGATEADLFGDNALDIEF